MSCHQNHRKSSPANEKFKFYKHLKVYLTFVGVTMFIGIVGRGQFHVPSFVFWWGLGVAIHYLNVFGWDSLFQEEPPSDRSYMRTNPEARDEEAESLVEMGERQPRPRWRDRDLV